MVKLFCAKYDLSDFPSEVANPIQTWDFSTATVVRWPNFKKKSPKFDPILEFNSIWKFYSAWKITIQEDIKYTKFCIQNMIGLGKTNGLLPPTNSDSYMPLLYFFTPKGISRSNANPKPSDLLWVGILTSHTKSHTCGRQCNSFLVEYKTFSFLENGSDDGLVGGIAVAIDHVVQ